VIGRRPGEQICLTLVWAVLDRASHGWRRLEMTPASVRRLQDLRRQLLPPPRSWPRSDGNFWARPADKTRFASWRGGSGLGAQGVSGDWAASDDPAAAAPAGVAALDEAYRQRDAPRVPSLR
jgi:hypothetical protein